jgi:alpha-tubulin suppressor-like RCC1 family protein
MRRVAAGSDVAFAIGEDGKLFSWRFGNSGCLGHGNTRRQRSPKRVEALRGVRVSSVAVGWSHALALAEDGLVYAWGQNKKQALLGNPNVERELTSKAVEALRGVRVGTVAASGHRSYAADDHGVLWAWGCDDMNGVPLGHGEQADCPLPKPIAALPGVRVDVVAASGNHTLALADDGSVYGWGGNFPARVGMLSLGPSVSHAGTAVRTPRRGCFRP